MQLPSLVQAIAQARFKRLKLRVVPMSLAAVLGLAGSLVFAQTIAPSVVQAYTSTVNVTIDVQPTETYDTLVRRAEAIARAATQRSFDRDILVTDVSIVIIAQGTSATVPVLSLATTRPQWRSQPDPRRWATYYSTSKALLGLNKAPSATTAQPTVTTATPATTSTTAQPRSTTPSTRTTPPTVTPGSATPDGSQVPASAAPSPVLPQRIPTPGNIGK
ncbi:hypothetical protein [Stenomitos frigidus]|uniref:hypothetical protein n=1 Tax=Stenomitos frigidus TaxID=1886765 RepID=UPI0015E6E714|nr:hypothetical protein [Stenomitos frigidus]